MIRNVTSITNSESPGEQKFCYKLIKCSKDISRERTAQGTNAWRMAESGLINVIPHAIS